MLGPYLDLGKLFLLLLLPLPLHVSLKPLLLLSELLSPLFFFPLSLFLLLTLLVFNLIKVRKT